MSDDVIMASGAGSGLHEGSSYGEYLHVTPGGRAREVKDGGRESAAQARRSADIGAANRLQEAFERWKGDHPFASRDQQDRALQSLAYHPDVVGDSGVVLEGSTAEVVAQLRRQNPTWDLNIGAEPRDPGQVKLATQNDMWIDQSGQPHVSWRNPYE